MSGWPVGRVADYKSLGSWQQLLRGTFVHLK